MYLLPTSVVHTSYHAHLVNHSLALEDETGKTSSDSYGLPQNLGLLADRTTRRCNSKVHDANFQTIYLSSFACAVLLVNKVEMGWKQQRHHKKMKKTCRPLRVCLQLQRLRYFYFNFINRHERTGWLPSSASACCFPFGLQFFCHTLSLCLYVLSVQLAPCLFLGIPRPPLPIQNTNPNPQLSR